MLLAALTTLAIVTQDQVPLRAAPEKTAAVHAQLGQGDNLEIRGTRLDYLQVYDHRRERAGYVRAAQVRVISTQPQQAGDLLAVLRFLKDTPGSEALGIAYAAAYLKAAPAQTIDAEPFDALGTMAERLAARASSGGATGKDVATHLETAGTYGVSWNTFDNHGRLYTCYEGEAYRRVLTLPANAEQRARAALGLTRHDCQDPAQSPGERLANDQWRAALLDKIQDDGLPGYLKNRLHLRRAGVWAALSHHYAQRNQSAQAAGERALQELAAVVPGELSENDAYAYADAAIRVGASRWAAVGTAPPQPLTISLSPGQPGETCITLFAAKPGPALAKRCTYGVVWPTSLAVHPSGKSATLAVQPLSAWRELWLFRQVGNTWQIDALPPATGTPNTGYLEFAGWTPEPGQFLAAREYLAEGRHKRSFEIIDAATLEVVKQADKPSSLGPFYRWQSPVWKKGTVSLR